MCSMVNDCIDPFTTPSERGGSSLFEGCEYNTVFEYWFGKILLRAGGDIPPGVELFARFGESIWDKRRSVAASTGISVWSRYPLNMPLPKSALDSEYLFLYEGPSLLQSIVPDAGVGLFAKYFIPAGTAICEYRGETFPFPVNNTNPSVASDKLSAVMSARGRSWVAVGTCPCACSNDAAWVTRRVYSESELLNITRREASGLFPAMPALPGFTYTALRAQRGGVKSLLHSTVDIPAGGEILNHFGLEYWRSRLTVESRSESTRVVDAKNG